MELVGYQRLIIWQKADLLAFQIYKVTKNFPKEELFGITSQIRRSGLSIPTNIVEGYSRNSKPEFKRFLYISLGSLAETKYLASFANRLGYINDIEYNKLYNQMEECGKLIWSFYQKIQK